MISWVERLAAGSLAALLCCGLLCACDASQSIKEDAARARLVGTWLREIETKGVKGRRVLTLEQDGKFSERAMLVTDSGDTARDDFAGDWTFDGTNLKRRYTHTNGRQFGGGRLRYATWELKSITDNDFVGIDRVEGHEIRYQRARAGTQP